MPQNKSIIIGIWVYAEPSRFQRTLDSVWRSTPEPFDLILLPDGPDPATASALARLQDLPQLTTDRVLGAPACFNRLISYNRADIVVFLESGSIVTPGWLGRLLDALNADPNYGLVGPSTNRAWNVQRLCDAPEAEAPIQTVEAYATQVAQHYQGVYRTLEPLHSLSDFCYVVKREVLEDIGGADDSYGPGPCWEMDYNIRATRIGFKGVWVCGAYVHRLPPAVRRIREEARLIETNKRRYQDKFCRLKLENKRREYCNHCEGDACEYFASKGLIQIQIGQAGCRRSHFKSQVGGSETQNLKPEAQNPGFKIENFPLVSCIMPTHNRRHFVTKAIEYFLRQDYPNRELIILDDGTDPVKDLVPDDPSICYLHLDHKGTIGVKRNLACQKAKGEIILHWDDDDWIAPWRLSYQVESLLKEQADLCGLDKLLFYDPKSGRSWQYVYPNRGKLWIAGGTLCYTKAFWRRNPFPDINVGEDTRFVWCNCSKKMVTLSDNTFYVALIHPGNTSPKRTLDSQWHSYAVEKIQDLIGEDRAFYVDLFQEKQKPVPNQRSLLEIPIKASNDMPLVSCIMPTYNRRYFVPQAIKHFLYQDYPNRELIIVDDGTDPVGDLTPEDPRIRYIHLPGKQSIGAKRNLACEVARGKIIICWDDDDWYAPNRISYQVTPLLDGGADITGLDKGLLFFLPTRQFWVSTPQLHARMFFQGVVSGTIAFWKRFWNQGTQFPRTSLAEDVTMLKALLHYGARLEKLANKGIFIYVRHNTNSWRFTPGNFLDDNGWQQVEPPSFLSDQDLEFYGISRQGVLSVDTKMEVIEKC